MCGIVGFTGSVQAAPVLLDGLRRLEYRGYDSAGVAVHDGERIEMVKASGSVANLAERTSSGSSPQRDLRHSPHPLGYARRSHRHERPSASERARALRRRAQRNNRELRRAAAASLNTRATSFAARPTPRSWRICLKNTMTATSNAPSCARPAGSRAASSSACSARRSRAGSSVSRRPGR